MSGDRFCPICNQPLHRHSDRQARWWCRHCQEILCEVLVKEDPRGDYKHADPYCPGKVVRK